MSATDELILSTDETLLVAVVMKLTVGSANPNTVRDQIARIRANTPEKPPEYRMTSIGWTWDAAATRFRYTVNGEPVVDDMQPL